MGVYGVVCLLLAKSERPLLSAAHGGQRYLALRLPLGNVVFSTKSTLLAQTLSKLT